MIGLRPRREVRVRRKDGLTSGGSGRPLRFDTEEEEQLMVRDYWTANRSRKIVAVEGRVFLRRSRQRELGVRILISEVVTGKPVKLVRAGLRGTRHVNGTGAAVFHRERV